MRDVLRLRRLIAVARGERPADLVLRGGLTAVWDGKVLARLRLPIAGLLTQEPLPRVAERLETLTQVARRLGVTLPHPFLTLSFVTLAVVPSLKMTDRGLVDVDAGWIVSLWVD